MMTAAPLPIAALERVRRAGLRTLAPVLRVPVVRRSLVERASRVPALLTAHAAAAFVVALLAPSLSLVLAPLVLGVPHVAADVRHLVIRRRLPRAVVIALGGSAAALLFLRVLAETHAAPDAQLIRAEHALASAFLLAGALVGARAGGWRWTGWGMVAAALVVAVLALGAPREVRIALLQGHNLVAVGIWLLLFRRGARRGWIPVAVILLGASLLGSGALLGVTLRHGALSVFGLHLGAAADLIAPGAGDARGLALTTMFAFLQAVHYAVWLIAIPQDDGRPRGRPSLPMTCRALVRDLSPVGLAVTVALMVTVAATGIVAPLRARAIFLSLVTFHAWLELALLLFFLARDGLGRAEASDPRAAP
jgi:hypothetical protein